MHKRMKHKRTHRHMQHKHRRSQLYGELVRCEAFGGGGTIELANFSMLTTMLFDVFSTEVAMLFAKSAPGIAGGLADCAGA